MQMTKPNRTRMAKLASPITAKPIETLAKKRESAKQFAYDQVIEITSLEKYLNNARLMYKPTPQMNAAIVQVLNDLGTLRARIAKKFLHIA